MVVLTSFRMSWPVPGSGSRRRRGCDFGSRMGPHQGWPRLTGRTAGTIRVRSAVSDRPHGAASVGGDGEEGRGGAYSRPGTTVKIDDFRVKAIRNPKSSFRNQENGWGTGIRTPISRSKVCCPAVGRSPNVIPKRRDTWREVARKSGILARTLQTCKPYGVPRQISFPRDGRLVLAGCSKRSRCKAECGRPSEAYSRYAATRA